MQNNVLKIQDDVLNLCEEILAEEIASNSIRKAYQERARAIQKFCNIKKFKLKFYGKTGSGKTTAICTLLDLISNTKTGTNKARFALPTSSEKTTPCPLTVKQSIDSQVHISIEPMTKDDFQQLLINYKSLYDLESEGDIKADEELRICRNMLGVSKIAEQDFIIKNSIEQMQTIINYDTRVETEFSSDLNNWSDLVKSILAGKHKTAPYPKSVMVALPNVVMPPFIEEITDTRGLGNGYEVRQDLSKDIESEDTIILMCERLGSTGEDIILAPLVTVFDHNVDSSARIYWVIFGTDEALLENADTESEDVSECMSALKLRLKGDYTRKAKKSKSADADSLEENILLFDGITKENASERTKIFFNSIEENLMKKYSLYKSELHSKLACVASLRSGKPPLEVLTKKDRIAAMVSEKMQHFKLSENISEMIIEVVQKEYASRIRACVNRNGDYHGLNYYELSREKSIEIISYTLADPLSELRALITVAFEGSGEIGKAYSIAMNDILASLKRNLLCNNNIIIENLCRENLRNNTVWNTLKGYWGDGCGNYKSRVIAQLEPVTKQFELNSLLAFLHNLCIEFYEKILVEFADF